MRMRWKQLHTLDHPLLLVIVEPILTRLEAGNDRMPCRCRMLGCMLARRTVTATDVPTLRTPAEMKPPSFRRCQAFHTPNATRLRSGVDPAQILFHFRFLIFVGTVPQRLFPPEIVDTSPDSRRLAVFWYHPQSAEKFSRWWTGTILNCLAVVPTTFQSDI